jgi:hypothetical protein
VTPALPTEDIGLTTCTKAAVPVIPGARGTALTEAQASQTIADQRQAALSKDRCAKTWQNFYDALRDGFGK